MKTTLVLMIPAYIHLHLFHGRHLYVHTSWRDSLIHKFLHRDIKVYLTLKTEGAQLFLSVYIQRQVRVNMGNQLRESDILHVCCCSWISGCVRGWNCQSEWLLTFSGVSFASRLVKTLDNLPMSPCEKTAGFRDSSWVSGHVDDISNAMQTENWKTQISQDELSVATNIENTNKKCYERFWW